VRDCDFTDSGEAVAVTTPVAKLQIMGCPGYNDQGKKVTGTVPCSGASFGGATNGYYGPLEFYVAGSGSDITEIAINGDDTYLTSGSFYLMPSETAALTHTGGIIHFLMIGK